MDLAPWQLDTRNHPLVKERVMEIANEIFHRIATGRYPFATRIPTERELADEFQETRTPIRQALDFLENYGVLTRRVGSGTFVTYRKPNSTPLAPRQPAPGSIDVPAIAESASPFELNIACSILEPEIVRLATLNMSSRDIGRLRGLLEDMERIVTDADQFAMLEKKFLMTIAEGTHNPLLVGMYTIIDEVRRQPQWCAIKRQSLSPDRIRDNQKRFRSLFNALEIRDAESAVTLMKIHIANMQEALV
ncbi:MAG: FadR/GntR family transcriptional regulator [Hyphomicrobiaceae bacterium]